MSTKYYCTRGTTRLACAQQLLLKSNANAQAPPVLYTTVEFLMNIGVHRLDINIGLNGDVMNLGMRGRLCARACPRGGEREVSRQRQSVSRPQCEVYKQGRAGHIHPSLTGRFMGRGAMGACRTPIIPLFGGARPFPIDRCTAVCS